MVGWIVLFHEHGFCCPFWLWRYGDQQDQDDRHNGDGQGEEKGIINGQHVGLAYQLADDLLDGGNCGGLGVCSVGRKGCLQLEDQLPGWGGCCHLLGQVGVVDAGLRLDQ